MGAAENEDGTISTINGCEFKGCYVEYGSTIYYALRNGEDKTITDKMALESGHFTYGFESKDPNAPAIKEAGITFRTTGLRARIPVPSAIMSRSPLPRFPIPVFRAPSPVI